MGEKKKSNANTTALIGAAFLMATSAIGPGFLTQTATFTGQYGSIFALAIICTILLDVTTQLNIWSIIGVSGMRGQDIANKVVPGLGYFIAFLVSLGGLVFNIGNVGGAAINIIWRILKCLKSQDATSANRPCLLWCKDNFLLRIIFQNIT